jgi:hypothetical protein
MQQSTKKTEAEYDAGKDPETGMPANWPAGVTPEEAYAWRRNRTIAGREQMIATGAARVAKTDVEASGIPDAAAMESSNTKDALKAGTRTRRRASAGNSGRVTTGPSSTPGVTAGGSARTLIGY